MKKLSKERPTTETNTPFNIETEASKEEVDSGKFEIEELEMLITALSLLVNNKNIDGGTLEIKIDPITKHEKATVFRNSDNKPFFMTEDPAKIPYLKDPKKLLETLMTAFEEKQATNKTIEGLQTDSTQIDPKKLN